MNFYKLTLKSKRVIISKYPHERGQHPSNGGWTFSCVFLPMFVPSRLNAGISPIVFRAKKRLVKYVGLASCDRVDQKGAGGVKSSPQEQENRMILPF